MKLTLTAALCCMFTTSAIAHNAPPTPKAPIVDKADTSKPHSGGTDKNGCHKNHKTGDFHCH